MKKILIVLASLTLAGCVQQQARTAKVVTLDEYAESERLVQPGDFAKQQEAIINDSVVLGPQVAEMADTDLRRNSRVRIAEEKPKSFISADQPSNKFKVSFAFDNVSMLAVAQMLSEVTGVNVLVGEEVQQSPVSAKLVNVPWDKALDAILKTKGLASHVDLESNIIRIHNQDTLVSLEDFDRKRTEDQQKRIYAQRAIEAQYTELFRLYYTDPETIKGKIISVLAGSAESVEGVAAPQITVDKRIKALIVKGTQDELDLVHRLIEQVDVRTRQILIEAFVVEATDDFDQAFGARLRGSTDQDISLVADNAKLGITGIGASAGEGEEGNGAASDSGSNLPIVGPFGDLAFSLTTTNARLRLELTAMEKEGLTKIVSNPRIFTLDNEQAVVFQGEQIPYESNAGNGGGTDVAFKDAGIKLTVTPSIVGDGNVVLDVSITKDSVNYANAIGSNPPIDKREVITKLLVKDRSVAVIGGVYKQQTSESEEKVPLLGDIPGIGNLFKRESEGDQRTELLIFLSPRII